MNEECPNCDSTNLKKENLSLVREPDFVFTCNACGYKEDMYGIISSGNKTVDSEIKKEILIGNIKEEKWN